VVDGRVSLDEIADYIRLINKKWSGSQVGAIGIDYMGLIESDGNDKEYEKISKIARELKHLAKEIKMPIVVLAQTNRSAADGTEEIYLHQGRGSGAIEETADYILGAFKSCEDETAGIIFKVLKNRRGRTGDMLTVDIDKTTFRYTGKAFKYESKPEQTSFKGIVMARPIKTGLDYYPMDTDIENDDKNINQLKLILRLTLGRKMQ